MGLPRIIAVTRKRSTWSHDTLQDSKIYKIDNPYHEEKMAPPMVRQAASPSTSLVGDRIQREPSLTIK
jgi:hypothetical protein